MTFGESTQRTSGEGNDLNIEIEISDQILFPTKVYPIPKNQSEGFTPLKLAIRLNNNTSIPLNLHRYQPFIPELLASDGRIIQRIFVTDEPVANTQPNRLPQHSDLREFGQWKIPVGYGASIPQPARLFWQNNLLQLQIFTSHFRLNNFWLFDALQPGTYQLRFILNIEDEAAPVEGLEPEKLETKLGNLATSFLNLCFVMPSSTDSNAIEVDDVQFKVEMPETVLTIPPRIPVAQAPVKLGIRVTNNTLTKLRFEQLDSLYVTLIGDDGKEINFTSDLMRLWVGKGQPKYYLVQAGESELFVLDGTLSWHFDQLQLAIPNKAGGFYYFGCLKPGRYQIGLRYQVNVLKADYFKDKIPEKVWAGCIALPFVEFFLSES